MPKKGKHTLEEEKEIAMQYLKDFSETAREPFLILDKNFHVIGANKSFYNNFHIEKKDTVDKLIFELGDGEWDIPKLRGLLENILPKKEIFNDFEVSKNFSKIGKKVMLLNARRLDSTDQILLAIEDITLKKEIERKLIDYTKSLEKGVAEKTLNLEVRIDELSRLNKLMVGREIEMIELKARIKELEK
ncbi:hypothetical protein ACFLZ0_01755 [Patescibacteria group bacterium]